MTAPTSPPETPYNPVGRLILGAVPPAIATFAGLWQILAPYMTADTRGFLYVAVILAWVCPIAVWIGCKVDKTDAKFAKSDRVAASLAEERHRRILERIERLSSEMFVFIEGIEKKQGDILEKLGCNERSLKGLHRHLDQTDQTLGEVTKEVEHLRKLVIEVDEIPAQRLGPRPLS
jgi:hypothetical protein